MLFSEKYGYKKVPMLAKDEMPLVRKNKILNLIYKFLYKDIIDDWFVDDQFSNSPALLFAKFVWTDFFNGNLFEVDTYKARQIVAKISKLATRLKWYEVYDYIEFILKNHPDKAEMKYFKKDILYLFKKEKIPLTIISNNICPSELDNLEENREIEKALSISDKYKPVKGCLTKALDLFSKRPKPDYANSIKESISAVDVLAQIILGKKGSLGKLINSLKIHPALKRSFSNLYGWTSDDAGIRHPKNKEPISCGEPEARYMLVTCSAFINYAIIKLNVGMK
ncbi:MAG TPA: hypothetical protein VF399_06490 [bacterium]